jgi:5-methylcytosine-specific restriction endonuclease McrA
MICSVCNEEIKKIGIKKRSLCHKCYMKEYNEKYLSNEEHRKQARERASKHHQENREKKLEQMKQRREDKHFDSKRFQVLERDKYTCQACKKVFPDSQLTVHHDDRLGRGVENPNNDIDNLITLCRGCHAKEHNKDLKEALNKKYEGRWSFKYDACIECGTTERRHQGKGLCVNCHARTRRQKNG